MSTPNFNHLVFVKGAKTYSGEKMTSSTNGSGKTECSTTP